LRRVGFELELSGVELADLAAAVARRCGGSVVEENPYRRRICGTGLGEYTVELDWALLSESRLKDRMDDLDPEGVIRPLAERLEQAVADLAGTVVPLEIVTPPLPIDQLDFLDDLRASLRELGAVGTEGSFAYAFGLHVNPQASSYETSSILRHLRAFLLLYDYLKEEGETDLSRRLTPFIDSFPKSYVERVMAEGYEPSRAELLEDYLDANPTRNRPLDLLPLFGWLDGERIRERFADELVKTRPTYHYRLPDCRIGAAEWRIADEWNRWVLIEELAADGDRLREMSTAYREMTADPLSFLGTSWKERVGEWL